MVLRHLNESLRRRCWSTSPTVTATTAEIVPSKADNSYDIRPPRLVLDPHVGRGVLGAAQRDCGSVGFPHRPGTARIVRQRAPEKDSSTFVVLILATGRRTRAFYRRAAPGRKTQRTNPEALSFLDFDSFMRYPNVS